MPDDALQVLLGAYSQRLWDTDMPTSRQLRIAVLDEKGRHEVRDLVEKVYRLAQVLVTPIVQLELCDKFGEEYITPKVFMDYFNQVRVWRETETERGKAGWVLGSRHRRLALFERISETHIHTQAYTYIYMHVFVIVISHTVLRILSKRWWYPFLVS